MIGKLTGIVCEASPDGTVVVDVQGVGYCVRVPLTLVPKEGGSISLYIHTAVRDDAIDLYGFAAHEELGFFRLLMSVSGVGPKTALSIMGASDSLALKRAIAEGNASTLHKVFGIGKKSAERIVVELKDKLALHAGAHGAHAASGTDGEVIEALMALGYSAAESRNALQSAAPAETIKDRLSAALRQLGSRAPV